MDLIVPPPRVVKATVKSGLLFTLALKWAGVFWVTLFSHTQLTTSDPPQKQDQSKARCIGIKITSPYNTAVLLLRFPYGSSNVLERVLTVKVKGSAPY